MGWLRRLGTGSVEIGEFAGCRTFLENSNTVAKVICLLEKEENKEIVAELCREMGKELKAIDDPWYKERILSYMIPY